MKGGNVPTSHRSFNDYLILDKTEQKPRPKPGRMEWVGREAQRVSGSAGPTHRTTTVSRRGVMRSTCKSNPNQALWQNWVCLFFSSSRVVLVRPGTRRPQR